VKLPEFEYLEPEDLDETLDLLSLYSDRAALLAGGTDIVDRLKKRLVNPSYIVSLKNLEGLNYIRQENEKVLIGARTPLVSVIESNVINKDFQALGQALKLVGAPTIQHYRGTIGGNLCLETRCIYYNQSAAWRSGRTRCHKDKGETCYAEENSDRCRSANVSDGACALMALGADIIVFSKDGKKVIPIEEFFTGKGENPHALEPNEMVTEIQIKPSQEKNASSFKKLTYRSAIDFAIVSAAVSLEESDGKILKARIAMGGAGASPLLLKEASEILKGKSITDNTGIDDVIKKVVKHTSPFMVDNLGSTLEYRQKMSGVMAKRALKEALERVKS
jgi:4-hydroxybenzoyl-CoA reductase beta subunit